MGRAEDLYNRFKQADDKESIISELITEAQSEELFLEFKTSGTDPSARKLGESDLKNFAKAISGFGNTEGGIVVWGVRCNSSSAKGDLPDTAVPLIDPFRFRSWLEGIVSACTVPAHPHVEHLAFETNDDPGKGYVISYIGQSDHAPHQVVIKTEGQYLYFMRSGSSFVVMPHGVLAAFFGRRPKPRLNLYLRIGATGHAEYNSQIAVRPAPGMLECRITFGIHNAGLGIALYPALRLNYDGSPDAEITSNLVGLLSHNSVYGLPMQIETNTGSTAIFFVGDVNKVIHPGSTMEIGVIVYRYSPLILVPPDRKMIFELFCDGFSVKDSLVFRLASRYSEETFYC